MGGVVALLGRGDNTSEVVTVSGESINDTVSQPTDAIAGVRWNADGTVDKKEALTFTQIDSGTDWVIPNGAASSDFEVRYTALTGDAFTTAAAAEDTWIDLGSARLWEIRSDAGDNLSNSSTFEIRKNGGAVLDSATYTITANNLP